MGEPASISTIHPIEARPPTPPRESERTNLRSSLTERVTSTDPRRSSRSAHLETPDSSLESPNNTSGSLRKRVGWAASAEYSDAPVILKNGGGRSPSLQPLLPSAARKPSKSILKAYMPHAQDDNIDDSTKLRPPHHYATFAMMLESVVQTLAGNDRGAKKEAYIILSSTLKASENVPDVKALKNQMSIICTYISQDLNAKVENTKTDTGVMFKPDSVLIVSALTLLASLMQRAIVAESFPLDFQLSFVEYAIKAFTDKSVTKEIVRNLMFLMGQQSFSPKAMNQDRVVRLVAALHILEHQVKGKSVVTGRLQVYRNILRRSKSHMLANTEWMQDLFVDMRSCNREIQNSAITFGLESSLVLGTEPGATRALTKLFDMEYSEGVCFANFYASSLKAMIKKRGDEGSAVPQIWSVIILFLRANPVLYVKWRFMKLFMDILTADCWNISDASIKCEANYAWNRYIFAQQLCEGTSPTVRARLFQPLSTQIKQRRSQTARKSALNSIYHLLYYAFSPNSTSARLDIYWDEYVKPLMIEGLITDNVRETTETAMSDIDEACTILRCLFDTSRQRPWNENRVFETLQQNTINVKELPALDAKWLRNRVSRVIPILSSLLEKLFWDLGGDESPITKLLQAYLRTIALPAKMEIKVSNDTMNCIASLFGIVHKIWTVGRLKISSLPQSKGPHGPNTTPAFLRCFEKIIITAIESLGLQPFTEKLLSISHDQFIAVATPSQQPKKIKGAIKCPLNHLILFLMTISPDLEYDQGFSSMVHRVLFPFFQARKSSTSKREFVLDLFNLLPDHPTPPSVLIWQVLADFASLATDIRDGKEASKISELPLGAVYRETMKILELGHIYSPSGPPAKWKLLFEALATSSSLDAGDAGRAVAVIEPLANALIPKDKNASGLGYLHVLLTKTSYPKDRQALDIARKRMLGFAQSTQNAAAFDPYIFLYEYIQVSLEFSYESFSNQNTAMYTDVIAATSNLFTRCPEPLLLGALIKTQTGVMGWISDPKSHLTGGGTLSQALGELWSIIINSIARISLSQKHNKLLIDLEPLISCGLESRHKSIVNLSIQFWNSTFGPGKEHLQYPDRVKAALVKLHPLADLLLPFFPGSLENEVSANQAQRVEFAETQNDSIYPGISSTDSFLKLRPSYASAEQISPTTRRLKQTTPQVIISSSRPSSLKKRSREATPDARGKAKRKKRDTTPKLRHEDSQVQFEAVQSSPIADRMGESQLLTEKQKETRERQRAEAGIFRDLRSSPRIPEKNANGQATEDQELPRHGSRSRSRSMSRSMRSPGIIRPATPTLMLPSDDDHFITSSPTPTRPVRDIASNEVPSSPPPKSVAKKRSTRDKQFASSQERTAGVANDVAMLDNTVSSQAARASAAATNQSSSGLPKPAPDNKEAQSLDPSAQVNPFAYPISLTSSAWESTGDVRSSSPGEQLRADASQHLDNVPHEEPVIEQPISSNYSAKVRHFSSSMPVLPTIENTIPTGTPARSASQSIPGQKVLRTPTFMNATSSPSSSDVNAMNEDVFEDAVSSPGSYIYKGKAKATSSPSEAEERSMLRIMEDYDRASSQPSKQIPSSAPKTKSSNKANSDAAQTQISSDRSRIPETPGVPAGNPKTYFDSDGEEVDMSQTIIVDDTGMEARRFTVKRRAGRSPLKKRKHGDVEDGSNEVPDSQEGGPVVEASVSPEKLSPSKREPPAKKTRRTSSRHSSQASLASEPSFELQSSRDVPRVELAQFENDKRGNTEDEILVRQSTELKSPNSAANDKVAITSRTPAVPETQFSHSPANLPITVTSPTKINGVIHSPQITQSSSQSLRLRMGIKAGKATSAKADQSETVDVEMLQGTRAPESQDRDATSKPVAAVGNTRTLKEHTDDNGDNANTAQGQASPDSSKNIQETTKDSQSKGVVDDTSGDVDMEQNEEEILASEPEAAMEDPNMIKAAKAAIEGIRSGIRSLYGKFPGFKLTRRTVSAIEDDLMDFKIELYAAGSRGRGLEEDEIVDEQHGDGVL